jgi:hypothetical protein
MLSSVLKSSRAVQVNIQIMRTFVRLRQMLISNETLIERLDELEENYDAKFGIVFRAIRQLMNPRAVKKSQLDSAPGLQRDRRICKSGCPETFKVTNCDLKESPIVTVGY